MAGFKNTFIGGMDKDTAKQKYSNNKYFNAENFRVITDEGLSNGALENVAGNAFMYDFPRTNVFFKIEESDVAGGAQFWIELSDGTQSSTYSVTYPERGLLDEVESIIRNDAFYFQNFSYTRDNDTLVIYHNTLDIVDITLPTASKMTEAVENHTIIGSTTIRDRNIIFTVDGNKPVTPTQIWSLEYDITDPVSNYTLKLLYNNNLGMSTKTPIEAVSRYENNNVQRIYWTSKESPLRTINVEEPNLLAYSPDLLSLSPFVDLDQPFVQDITTGSLPSGQYQMAYRLSKDGGSVGALSPISSPVALTAEEVEPSGADTGYEIYSQTEPGIETNKGIVFKINEIDTDFDSIETYIIQRENGGLYRAYLAPTRTLTGASSFTYTLNTLDILEEIGVAEVFDYDIDFEEVKTLAIKDNSLIVGNVKESTFTLDYDARAYRFKRSTTDTYFDSFDLGETNWGAADDADLINPYNKDATIEQIPEDNYRYQLNSNVIGGSGPNISYKFTNDQFLDGDYSAEYSNTSEPDIIPYTANPVRNTTFNLNGRTTNIQNQYFNYKDGTISARLKGYMRDEVYRFGVVFYSKSGKPSQVKWIGDIRFPEASLKALLRNNTTDETVDTRAVGIEFTLDVTSIRDRISGYQIVRAPRTQADKTIVGQGVLTEVENATNTVDGNIYYNATRVNDTNDNGFIDTTKQWKTCTFDCPDSKMIGGTIIDENFGDYYLKPVQSFIHINSAASRKDMPVIATAYTSYYRKSLLSKTGSPWATTYTFSEASPEKYGQVAELKKIGEGKANVLFDGTKRFYNRGFLSGYVPDVISGQTSNVELLDDFLMSPGTHTMLITMRNDEGVRALFNACNNRPVANLTTDTPPSTMTAICNLYRRLDTQYGGDTFEARKKTEYIVCGDFVTVNNTSTSITTDVFGGDTQVSVVAEKKLFSENATWTLEGTEIGSGDPVTLNFTVDSPASGLIYPVETTTNVDMRNGTNLNTSASLTDVQINDEWILNPVYNLERAFKNFIPEAAAQTDATNFDNRMFNSEIKVNGEANDSWSIFKPLNFLDVDGHYGPINKLEVLNDKLYFFQDRAFGEVAYNPRTIITDAEGSELELGTGGGLVDYKYYSDSIGSRHQFGVVKSRNSIYWFDANSKKFYRFQGGGTPLSDMKGMSSYFYNEINGDILTTDTPTDLLGITGTYDNRFNEVLYTFNGVKQEIVETLFERQGTVRKDGLINNRFDLELTILEGQAIEEGAKLQYYTVNNGQELIANVDVVNLKPVGAIYIATIEFGTNFGSGQAIEDLFTGDNTSEGAEELLESNEGFAALFNTLPFPFRIIAVEREGVTVAYNEFIDAFSGFYSFTPRHYINDSIKVISQDPKGVGTYMHDENLNKAQFYGVDYPSKLTLLVNPAGDTTKVFNNIEYLSTVDDLGNDIVDDTINKFRIYNEYQDTSIDLIPEDNVKRRMRTWRFQTPRSGTENARFRNPYIFYDLEYTNENRKHLVLNDITTYYTDSPM